MNRKAVILEFCRTRIIARTIGQRDHPIRIQMIEVNPYSVKTEKSVFGTKYRTYTSVDVNAVGNELSPYDELTFKRILPDIGIQLRLNRKRQTKKDEE